MAIILDDYLMELLAIHDEVEEAMPRRILRDVQNPVEAYSELQFIQRYRFSKDVFLNKILPLTREVAHHSNRGRPLPHMLCVTTALRFYATGSYQQVVGDVHGISQSYVCQAVNNISRELSRHLQTFIQLPKPADIDRVKKEFYKIGGFPHVTALIDGTHIPIQNPSRQNGEIFRNRKGFFSLNVQVVCGPDMKIFDIVCRFPGRAHDSRIFNGSAVKQKYANKEVEGLILGDSGYGQTPYLYTPLDKPVTRPEKRYQRAHLKTRNLIERTFGVWKRRFPCLSKKTNYKLINTNHIIVACAVLHNIGIKYNFVDFDEPIQDPIVPLVNVRPTARGSAVKKAFITRFFDY